ncbi:hypothetical protein [Stenotrophomonas sp. PS02289]|uniref:hypothetical protein n=1 Tax=Stenotrophomonas sp. PS02289 TaxID=2991422 RepID=UPI00249CCF98|nr:hypothetical protein [Stenotrophomonas sp. PS02289]
MQQLAEDFWNFRGHHRVAGVLDVGTQMSLIRRTNGRFLLLDSYSVDEDDRAKLLALTGNGDLVEAIINVHPFHTLHCYSMHQLLPRARMIGTRRHQQHAPTVRWDPAVIEDPVTQQQFREDLDFSIPDGLDLVTSDEKVHAASVLVRHRRSGIVHVDDTLNVLAAPGWLGKLLPQSRLKFHPMLGKALRPVPEAADAFSDWARTLAAQWADSPTVCAAHSAVRQLQPGHWQREVLRALADVEPLLERHRKAHL